ncbi:glycosyltransferase family A protein [Oceanobacillus sp. CFH 90083]|uniref:glycosyltransferase family 2 protein n=1 Tax=Oceanobacillus sp. CFH 90083 TaxID=2592336 RepID=UPI00128C3D48|nr:glycosyltransferase family A protein [Oceanobacillus sp. CFH 90083]
MKQPINKTELHTRLQHVEEELTAKRKEAAALKETYSSYKSAFLYAEALKQKAASWKKSSISLAKAIPSYAAGRRNIKKLYSTSYKQKDASNQLKQIKNYLYDLGFEERALSDLQDILYHSNNKYLIKAAAWELGLWFANKQTPNSAEQAIIYLEMALDEEQNIDLRRRMIILLAEAYKVLGRHAEGMQLIKEALKQEQHADLLLALANLCPEQDDRLFWINEVLHAYQLEPLYVNDAITGMHLYDKLDTNPIQIKKEQNEQPKITVIIPAYNSESGISVALRSLTKQTWSNLEIIVVDDCSPDHTAAVVKEWIQQDDRIKLLQAETNAGPYVARNIALNQATGEFVTINDADDWSHPQKIEIQARHLIDNPSVIANTSEHARLTEDLYLYRRGMPGKYIFSNMSSIMFRRLPVLEKVGFWDEVRFAADSEFKKRLALTFGRELVKDLPTGPLSFPMQSSGSLTGNSSFGYNGFLMGARKEYAEAHNRMHQQAGNLYFPYQQERRFPVPKPMLEKNSLHSVDVAYIADFRQYDSGIWKEIKLLKEEGLTIGLIQRGIYDLKQSKLIHQKVRDHLDGEYVKMLVYGEKAEAQLTIIKNPLIFQDKQRYLPELRTTAAKVIINKVPKKQNQAYNMRQCAMRLHRYIGTAAVWYPANPEIREQLIEEQSHTIRYYSVAASNWTNKEQPFIHMLKDNFVIKSRREEGGYEDARG